MAEYIERDKLIQDIRSTGASKDLVEAIVCRINLHRAADVVEVVRCKDCKWCSQSGLCNLYISFTPSMKPDDFCSYGERRADDETG